MTEQHECEWVYAPDWKGGNIFVCIYPDCENKLSYKQTSRRLNEYETLKKATEALSAEHARETADALQYLSPVPERLRQPQIAYADILEGK